MVTLPGHSSTQSTQKLYLASTIPEAFLDTHMDIAGLA
jgi:hypothetical protein